MAGIRFESDGSTVMNGITVNTPFDNDRSNQTMNMQDFLQLMIAEMKNQDFMAGSEGGSSQSANTSNYITQMAQMSTMQQMEELAYYSKTNYAMSLVGKSVTVATLGLGGNVKKDSGIVEKVTLSDDEYYVYVNGKSYKLSEVMNVGVPGSVDGDALSALEKSVPIILDKQKDSIRLRWDAPKVTTDEEKKLVYEVYYLKADDKTYTAEEIAEKGKSAGDTSKAEGTERYYKNITDLEPGETYQIAVFAVSPSGKKYPYQTTKVKM